MATLVLRTVKGSPLTNLEVDGNFSNIDTEVGVVFNTANTLGTNVGVVFNTANTLSTNVGVVFNTANTINSNVGVITNLNTVDTSNVVVAINEVLTRSANATNLSSGTISVDRLPVSGVVATTYGGSSQIPVIVVDDTGRITSAANTTITLGSMATQESNDVDITGGSITGLNNLTGNTATFSGEIEALDFNSTSDIVLKENINDLENCIDILNKLQPKQFTWKNGGGKSYGLIAQEVEKIIPDIVKTRDDGFKSVNYLNIIAFLIEAVKNLNTQIQELKRK